MFAMDDALSNSLLERTPQGAMQREPAHVRPTQLRRPEVAQFPLIR